MTPDHMTSNPSKAIKHISNPTQKSKFDGIFKAHSINQPYIESSKGKSNTSKKGHLKAPGPKKGEQVSMTNINSVFEDDTKSGAFSEHNK